MKQFRLNEMSSWNEKPEIKVNASIEYYINKLEFFKFISKNRYFGTVGIIKKLVKNFLTKN